MTEMITIINVADMTDQNDPQGRTFRQVNAAKTHAIPLGALVELETGERLRVMMHTRDCDQTRFIRSECQATTKAILAE